MSKALRFLDLSGNRLDNVVLPLAAALNACATLETLTADEQAIPVAQLKGVQLAPRKDLKDPGSGERHFEL